ncbi:MAG: radical SAM protein [Pseudomonadota bacterium]
MKIAMVAPYSLFCPNSRQSEDERINNFIKTRGTIVKAHSPSDSLLQLAAFTPENHELVYMDDQYGNIDTNQGFDLAAITCITVSANRAYKIADEFRQKGVYVVMGGIHTTLCPEDAAKHADTIVVGDADDVWQRFLFDFENGVPKNFYDGGRADIRKRPPPRISLVPREWYFLNMMQKEMYAFSTTLGCTRACKFCSDWKKPGYNRLQKKTIEQIKQELEQIASYSDNYSLLIMDDNVFLDVSHGKKVLEVIKSLNVRWIAATDISIAEHPSLLKMIRESGCRLLSIGLESLNEENLKWLAPWKAKQVKSYKDAINKLREEGINAVGSFMVALEYDTKSTFEEIFEFFIESKLSGAAISILTPAPGTELRNKLIKEGRLDLKAPWKAYSGYNLLFKHPTLSKKDIYDGLFWFLQKCETPEMIEHLKRISFE